MNTTDHFPAQVTISRLAAIVESESQDPAIVPLPAFSYAPSLLAVSAFLVFGLWYAVLRVGKDYALTWGPSGKRGTIARLHCFVKFFLDTDKALASCRALLQKKLEPIALDVFTYGRMIFMPAQHAKWYAENVMDESSIDLVDIIAERFGIKYTMPCALTQQLELRAALNPTVAKTTRDIIPLIRDALQHESEKIYKRSVRGKHPDMDAMIGDLVVAAHLRSTVGDQLSDDEEYFNIAKFVAQYLGAVGLLILVIPWPLKPLVGIPTRWLLNRYVYSRILPKNRDLAAAHILQREVNGVQPVRTPFLDGFSARIADMDEQTRIELLAKAILVVHFAAIQNPIMTARQCIYNILGHPSAKALIEELRDELRNAQDLHGKEKFPETPNQLDSLHLMDAVILETIRLHPLDDQQHPRIITREMTTPDGVVLKPGSYMSLLATTAQYDDAYFENPNTFDPHRYLRMKHPLHAYDVSGRVLGFGYAKHACPGRWIAIAEMKLIVGQLLMDFDFEPMAPPKPMFVGLTRVPALDAKVRMRRREDASQGQ